MARQPQPLQTILTSPADDGDAGLPAPPRRTGQAAVLRADAASGASLAQPSVRHGLTGRQKAAIIVRLLLAENVPIRLSALPEHLQAALTEQIGQMRLVDRTTLRTVIEDFVTELEQVGLAFPGGIDGAIAMLDGHISATAANRLRRLAGASAKADPWERISTFDIDRLLPLLEQESVEVGAVMLSKLGVTKAAQLLQRLPGERARRVAYAVSLTGRIDPEVVRRIGLSLLTQIEAQPPSAFDTDPVQRVGAILNSSPDQTRQALLTGLEETDPDFAERVRKAIFTFAHIPARVGTRDVPRIQRAVEQSVFITALAAGRSLPATAPAVEYILANLSQRMAASLREEMADRGTVRPRDGEAAMAEVVVAIRRLETAGEIRLSTGEEGED